MLEKMDDKLNIILKFYQDLLIKINKSSSITRFFYGNPTKALRVNYSDKQNDYIWRITPETIELISKEPVKPLPQDTQKIKKQHSVDSKRHSELSGMYWDEGTGFFSFEGEKTVIVDYNLGPLYGRTFQYEIVKENHRIKLINEKTIMVS
jgi:hypothetical protein